MTDLYKAMMPCPRCHGNGYVRDKRFPAPHRPRGFWVGTKYPTNLTSVPGEVHVDCDLCDSQGEVPTTADVQEQEGQQ